MIHRELRLRLAKNSDSRDLIQAIAEFCEENSGDYLYLRDQSTEYSKAISADACQIHRHSKHPFPSLAFASGDGATMRLTNIVPYAVAEIEIEEYNQFASHFAETFKKWGRGRVNISITSGECRLEDAIPGVKNRSYFESYLASYPTSYHPLDIERLDTFISACFRYSRGRVDVDILSMFLKEKCGWEAKDVKFCCERIRTGLDILRTDRRF